MSWAYSQGFVEIPLIWTDQIISTSAILISDTNFRGSFLRFSYLSFRARNKDRQRESNLTKNNYFLLIGQPQGEPHLAVQLGSNRWRHQIQRCSFIRGWMKQNPEAEKCSVIMGWLAPLYKIWIGCDKPIKFMIEGFLPLPLLVDPE